MRLPWACSGDVPDYGKRQNRTVQLQAGRGGKIVERGVRPRVRSQRDGAGGEPNAG